MKKLDICSKKIEQCKKNNYNEAAKQFNRILAEKEKLQNMKKDKNVDILLQHFEEEIQRWKDVMDKNKLHKK